MDGVRRKVLMKPSSHLCTALPLLLLLACAIASPAQTFNTLLSFDGSDGDLAESSEKAHMPQHYDLVRIDGIMHEKRLLKNTRPVT